ncbi:MAG: hypothetical protein JO119_12285 [Acidobacteria bacterium]|nr:hypothetical protein [Acidobacteriota bacterium]
MISLVCLFLLVSRAGAGQSVESPFGRIRSQVAVETLHANSTEIAGVYRNPPDENGKVADSSAVRTALYLFPDGTYLYVQRALSMPPTIFDKGTWRIVADVVELKSAREVTWNPDLERKFLMLRRSSHPEEFLLVGTDVAVKRFERLAGSDGENALLTVAKKRKRVIEPERAARVKGYLMRKAWHPERFGDAPRMTF